MTHRALAPGSTQIPFAICQHPSSRPVSTAILSTHARSSVEWPISKQLEQARLYTYVTSTLVPRRPQPRSYTPSRQSGRTTACSFHNSFKGCAMGPGASRCGALSPRSYNSVGGAHNTTAARNRTWWGLQRPHPLALGLAYLPKHGPAQRRRDVRLRPSFQRLAIAPPG